MSNARGAHSVECQSCHFQTQLRRREDGTFKSCKMCGGQMRRSERRWVKFAERAKLDLQSMHNFRITLRTAKGIH